MGERVSAAAALVDILEREGVRAIFGIPGGPVLPLYDELARHSSIRIVLTKHEQAAAYSALAYAKVSGELGVCVGTLGPGATNLLAGLPAALTSSVPILAITGQVQTTGYGRAAHQESTGWFGSPDQQAMFAATCKHTATCVDPARLPDLVRGSIRIAWSGRPGPTHVILPANLLHQTVDYTPLEPSRYRILENRSCDESAIGDIADRIARARFPAILLGERADASRTGLAVQGLAERYAIPVATDLAAKSAIDEASPMFLGCIGVLGHRAAEHYLKERADLIVAIGQTFDEVSTLSWDPAFFEGRELIQVDVDAAEIGKVFPVTAGTVGHLPTIAMRLADALARARCPDATERRRTVSSLRERHPLFADAEMRSERVPLLPQRVVAEVREAVPREAIVLADSSKWTRWLGRYFQAERAAVVTVHDYEPMGWAVAGAIGAKVAAPDRPVMCVSGDGAFLMSAMELSTAANYELPIAWVVMNDSRLGIIYDLQKGLYGGRVVGTTFENPDLVSFARSFGISGAVIERPGDLSTALRDAVSRGVPAVLDVRFDADEIPAVRPRSLLITKQMGLPNPTPSPEATRALIKLLKEK